MTAALFAILLVTIAAPLLARFADKYGYLRAGLDGFVLMTVMGLVVLVLIPDALSHRGEWAVAALLIGFFLPAIAEFLAHKFARESSDCHQAQSQTHKVVLIISCFAIIFHALMDGAILALARTDQASFFLSVGVVAHRLGIAVTLWWLMRPYISSRTSYLMVFLFALVTYLGFQMAASVSHVAEASFAGLWQAFAAGSLLHVVLHPLRDRNIPYDVILRAQRMGTAIALIFIVAGIYSALELTKNPGFNHIVVAAEKQGASHHTMEESLYVMQQAGIISAPFLLAVIVIGALVRARVQFSIKAFFHKAAGIAPLTFFIWLLVSAFYALAEPHVVHDHIFILSLDIVGVFYAWLAVVACALLFQGAPQFFSTFLPDVLSHKHSHDH